MPAARYIAAPYDMCLRHERGGEYHIAKATGFYIAFEQSENISNRVADEVYRKKTAPLHIF